MVYNDEIWKTIEDKTKQYKCLGLNEIAEYDKYYLYSLISHSTAIEGSALTELDTQILFDKGLTAKGKPLMHHLMNEDLRKAYNFAFQKAGKKTVLTPEFLQTVNALIMKSTGGENNTIAGTFDSSKGDFRLCGVTAGYRGSSYMDYRKIPAEVAELCTELNKQLMAPHTLQSVYTLSFEAHFRLVIIHPWLDGNGRTSRLMMHYIQYVHNAVLTRIHREDTAEYITSLAASREKEDLSPFIEFMAHQHLKTLEEEITNYRGGLLL